MFNNGSFDEILDQVEGGMPSEELFLRWNVGRIRFVAILFLVMQLLNVAGGSLNDPGQAFSLISCTLLNVGALVFSLTFAKGKVSLKTGKTLHMLYWILLPLTCTFYFVYDIETGGLPSNLLLVYLFLSTVPIMQTREVTITFIVPFVLNIVLGIMYGALIDYYFYGAVYAACGLTAGVMTGRQYIRLIARLRFMSSYDQLTGLLTRHVGIPRAEMLANVCRRNGGYLVMLMLDIDLFKNYNDTFGHVAGDETLKRTANAVSSCLKRSTDVTMRFGGEEFAVFFAVENSEAAKIVIERIERAIDDLKIEAAPNAPKPYLTLSIGGFVSRVGVDVEQDEVIQTWTKHADDALYRAKDEGRARHVITYVD